MAVQLTNCAGLVITKRTSLGEFAFPAFDADPAAGFCAVSPEAASLNVFANGCQRPRRDAPPRMQYQNTDIFHVPAHAT